MRDNTLQQITHNASEAIQAADLPKSQLITYKSFDGRLISAVDFLKATGFVDPSRVGIWGGSNWWISHFDGS